MRAVILQWFTEDIFGVWCLVIPVFEGVMGGGHGGGSDSWHKLNGGLPG